MLAGVARSRRDALAKRSTGTQGAQPAASTAQISRRAGELGKLSTHRVSHYDFEALDDELGDGVLAPSDDRHG